MTLTLISSDTTLGAIDLESHLAIEYGVDVDDINIDAAYIVTGTIDIDVSEDVTDNELEQNLKNNIANALGVHLNHVQVNINPSTGDVTYTIVSDSDNDASALQNALDSPSFLDDLNHGISNALPSTTISEITIDDEIELEIVAIIDASESGVDIEDANTRAIMEFENQGFIIDAETAFVTARPTTQPIISPASSIPSASPSATGMVVTLEMRSIVTTSLTIDELEAIEAEIAAGLNATDGDIRTIGIHNFQHLYIIMNMETFKSCIHGEIQNIIIYFERFVIELIFMYNHEFKNNFIYRSPGLVYNDKYGNFQKLHEPNILQSLIINFERFVIDPISMYHDKFKINFTYRSPVLILSHIRNLRNHDCSW